MQQPSTDHRAVRLLHLVAVFTAALLALTGCDDSSTRDGSDTRPDGDAVLEPDGGMDTLQPSDTTADTRSDVPTDTAADTADARDTTPPPDVEQDHSDLAETDTADTADAPDTQDTVEPPPPPPHFTLSCDPPPTGVGTDVVAAWAQEKATRFDGAGHPATAALQGLPGALHGALRVDFDHAATMLTQADYVYVTDAVVEGHGTGTLELETHEPAQFAPTEIQFERFEATGLTAQDAVIDPANGLRISGTIPVTAGAVPNLRANTADLGVASEHPATPGQPGFVGELRVRWLYTRQIFYPDGTAISVPQDIDAQPVVVVHSGSGLYPWPSSNNRYTLEFEGSPTLPGAMAIHATDADLFSAAGNFSSGSLQVPAVGFDGPVAAIFGRGGTIRYDDSGALVSDGPFRLTQAIDAAGALLPAHLELAPSEVVVQVPQGAERIVTVAFREASFEGDALLGEVQFTTDAPDETIQFELASRTVWFRWLNYAIFGGDPLWAKPLLVIVAVISDTIETVGQVLGCVFTFGFGCDFPSSPDLERFPGHIPAGDVGGFDVLINGNGDVGSRYTATLTYVGQNYCPATVTFDIEIVAPCTVSAADFCSASMAACGSFSGTDACGLQRTEDCGSCTGGAVCVQNSCCQPWSNDELCNQNGAECGSLTATDNCNTQRTVDCGGCAALLTCRNNTCSL